MPYGILKVDTITFTNGGVDQSITVSGIVASTSGNLTVTGTVSGNVIRGGTTVSGATVTGSVGQFGNLTAVSGVFTTQISGSTVTGNVGQFTSVTGGTAGFTTVTGTTVTGTTANFVTVSGATVTGTTANFVTVSGATVTGGIGSFTTLTGGVTTITSGVFATGSATNPSISFTSDPNTGIYSPGADQVAISTNGTGRLFVDANGNTHVNAVDGQLLLSKTGARSYQLRVTGAGGNEGLAIRDESGATEIARFTQNGYFTVGGLRIKGSDTQNSIYQSAAFGLSSDNYITIGTGASQTERLRIDSSGRLGLGTSSPGELLDLAGGSVRLNSTNGIYKANSDGFNYLSGGTSVALGGVLIAFGQSHATNPNEIHFRNSGNLTRAVIDASGRVGIGTAAPSNTLHLAKEANHGITLERTVLNPGSVVLNVNSFGAAALTAGNAVEITAAAGAYTAFKIGTTEAARIDSSSRLLVGTSSSVQSDAILQAKDGAILVYHASSATSAGYDIRFATDGGATGRTKGAIGALQTAGNGGNLVFSTTADGASSPTERMRIGNNGNVAIGTTDTTGRLAIQVATNGDPGIYFRNQSGTNVGQVQVSSGSVSYVTTSDYRLKENVVPLTGAIDRLQQIPVHRFNFITDTDTTVDGFLAHEAQAVVPECVTGEKDAVDDEGNPVYQGIDQSKLVPLLTAALQEALQKIDAMEARLAALEGA